jgi:hypothetical protein
VLGIEDWLPTALPWIGVALFLMILFHALKARSARIDDHRTGRTL